MESSLCVISKDAVDEVVADWVGTFDLPLLFRQDACDPQESWISCAYFCLFCVDGISKWYVVGM